MYVYRLRGDRGAVSATFSTSDQSAVAGVDYVAVNEVLSWGDGDMTARHIEIPLIDNDAFDNFRFVRLNLAAATGGAVISVARGLLRIWNDDVDDQGLPFGGIIEIVWQN